jgi:glycosyltransferase involved in cell wall biosynthesis
VLRAEAWRYRRHVVRLLPRFHTAVAVSTVEADELRALGRTRVELIPTGVDTAALRPQPEQAGPPRLLFTGTMSYPPNHRGIRWFAREVWPLVRARRPDAVLDVVGKAPPDDVLALDGVAGITVHGFVDSMAPFFARAHSVVVPILAGAGIRVKIVEAMAAGRAVISTPLGCEGLAGLEPGRHLLVAEEPGAFADGAVRLLEQPELRERLAAAGRELAERSYDWRPLGDQLERVLMDAAAR